MSDIEPTNENTDEATSVEEEPTPAYGNPEPPYDFPMPQRFANTPFDELPRGLQHRVRKMAEAQAPNIPSGDTGPSVDPAIAPPDTAGTV